MLADMNLTHLAALAGALGFASGMRLYAVVCLTGLAGAMGWVPLPMGLAILEHPAVIGASGLMTLMEFVADKVPWVDSIWDTVHTVIRVPAGAALAAGVFGGMNEPAWQVIAALMGGTLAATAHVAKATTRAAVNTSPEPFSNIGLSLLGDLSVPAMLWLAWEHPIWFFAVLAVMLIIAISLIVLLFRFTRKLVQKWRNPAAREPAVVVEYGVKDV